MKVAAKATRKIIKGRFILPVSPEQDFEIFDELYRQPANEDDHHDNERKVSPVHGNQKNIGLLETHEIDVLEGWIECNTERENQKEIPENSHP